jgi:hypothetical protein
MSTFLGLPAKFALPGLILVILACLGIVPPASAAAPEGKQKGAPPVPALQRLRVEPAAVSLTGPRSMQQLVITGEYADGSLRDLTGSCELQVTPQDIAGLKVAGLVVPRKDGTATLTVKVAGLETRVPIAVKDYAKVQPVRFRNEVMAILTQTGCNSGTCHGSPTGKNGFHLSLRGYDPHGDFGHLTREGFGRRASPLDADASLILQKGLGRVPHEGGQRFLPGSLPAEWLRAWVAQGAADDPPDSATLQKISVTPSGRLLTAPGRWQQLAVQAHWSDGTVCDVTRLSCFSSSDTTIADVSTIGQVEFSQGGEVAILCRYLDQVQSVRLTYLANTEPVAWQDPPANNFVDRHVFSRLRLLQIPPADLCTDAEFLRRAYLDLCGILPTPEDARKFLADTDKSKRAREIDLLLERPEYADFWALKWGDVLRVSRDTHRLKGAYLYRHWLRGHIERNTPFDQVARQLLTSSGNTFVEPSANFYRIGPDTGYLKDEEIRAQLAETTAQVFCGIRLQCAKCHNHPLERWTQEDYYGMAAFFARVQRKRDPAEPPTPPHTKPRNPGAEIIYPARGGEALHPTTGLPVAPRFLGGQTPVIPAGKDRREVLADWLTAADNPFLARSVVNRIWFHLNGRGIVDAPDDFRDSNPPANDELLDALARDFTAHRFDVKHSIRVIMNSRTYQLSGQTNPGNQHDNKYFSHALVKLHGAEQLLDAICAATAVPEKYEQLPLGTRAMELPDGKLQHVFLQTFNKPLRDSVCECERDADSSLPQALQLLNGQAINDKLSRVDNRIGRLLDRKLAARDILQELYLATLSRPPSAGEAKKMLEHVAQAKDQRKAWEDIQRALLNSQEFLFRH